MGVGFGVAVGVGSDVGTGPGAAFFTGTPLLHTSFLPDLIQVNFKPFTVEVIPAFLQMTPCLTAPLAEVAVRSEPARTTTQILAAMRMPKGKGGSGQIQ